MAVYPELRCGLQPRQRRDLPAGRLAISGSSTEIDTASLGGSGTAILRVTASDGVNSAYADSDPFVMAPKPPQPFILSPDDNLHIHYGQLVNFSGMALDAQDGTVADAGLPWWDENLNVLGNGPLLSLDNLPVGENEITFQATNSLEDRLPRSPWLWTTI